MFTKFVYETNLGAGSDFCIVNIQTSTVTTVHYRTETEPKGTNTTFEEK